MLHIIQVSSHKDIKLYVLGPFHLQKSNKFYRKYKPVSRRITQQKEHLLIWNSETTQNLNIYLHNYQTERTIFLATKHEKIIMACNYLNFSIQKIYQNSKNDFEAVLINFSCMLWIYYSANASEAVQKRRLVQGHCWTYANSLNS